MGTGAVDGLTESKWSERETILSTRRREHVFYTAMALAAITVAATGFSGTIGRELSGSSKLTLLVHVHAAVAVAWLFLFLVRVRLVAGNNPQLHRALGTAGVLLAITHVLVGCRTAIVAAARGFDLSGGNDPLGFMIFPLGDLLAFTILVGTAFAFRRRSAAHKRLMLLALATTVGAPMTHFVAESPSLASMPNVVVAPLMLFWFGSAVFDRFALGKMHPISIWGGLALFAWGNVRAIVLMPSEDRHRLAKLLTS